mgnify:CR=1 FL=1
MRYTALAFVLFIIGSHLQGQGMRFFREDISFVLEPGSFHVDGYYYFNNPGPHPIQSVLRYPFPTGESFGRVDSIFCYPAGRPAMDAAIRTNQQSVDFQVQLAPGESKTYHIGYQQKLEGNKALYILRSTASWGMAFDTINYRLEVKNLVIDSLSYIPDKVVMKENSSEYYWRKRNFMPLKDFVVLFRQ